jgi:hypothetical protein
VVADHRKRPGERPRLPARHVCRRRRRRDSPGSKSTARSSWGKVVQCDDSYRLCYIREPEGLFESRDVVVETRGGAWLGGERSAVVRVHGGAIVDEREVVVDG